MKNKIIVVVAAAGMILGSLVLVGVLFALRSSPETREPPQMAMIVDAIPAEITQERFQVSAQGTVRPRTETEVMAEVSGQITQLSDAFVAGGFFRAGEVLIEIDRSNYQTTLAQAEAELERLVANHRLAQQELERFERLFGQHTVSESDLQQKQSEAAQAAATVKSQQATVRRARRDLERTRISLPYDGLVRRRTADLGQYVGSGTPLGVAFAVDIAEVRLPLSERDMAYIDLPRPGFSPEHNPEVMLEGEVSGKTGTWRAEIVRTEGVVDESTRLTYAVARITDPYGLLDSNSALPLPIGTFVNARIEGRSASGLVALPRAALREGDRVYIANGDEELEVRQVAVVRSTPETVFVANDLKEGDRVITSAIQAPIPGLALRIRELSPAGEEDSELRLLPADDVEIAEAESGRGGEESK